ncbi:MAG: hypothetical protein ACRC7G_11425 [Beijerinckiaceae bacterium]
MIAGLLTRRSFETPCTVELERNGSVLQAHVDLLGVEVEAGDTVQVHDAPSRIGFGEREVYERTATVTRGNVFDRFFTKVSAYLELTQLYEVGFDAESFFGPAVKTGR